MDAVAVLPAWPPVLWIKDILVNTVLANMYLATASGAMLRMLAWGVNLTAKPATAAKGAIHFYKEDARHAGTVAAGTVIQTKRINGVIYAVTVDADTTLAAGLSGFKSVIDAQPWIISKVTHSLGGSGFVTTLNLEVLLSDVSYEAAESSD
ncbi:baseplate J/gp47 family protein [Rahnella perminowiae]|uniref:baseplate J/gp47 family protein n=1 Tax=Rahnella perminowiae TaxID=2816244 RepID=UPI0038B48898